MSHFLRGRPGPDEYPDIYAHYVPLVPGDDVLAVLDAQPATMSALAARAGDRETYRYAKGKWSVREVVGHVLDAERVFIYRLVAIARGESNPLPGFDEDEYMKQAPFARVPLADLAREFDLLRRANVMAIRQLDETAWHRVGNANRRTITVRALAFVMASHLEHHFRVLHERYGV
jgi:hypothetical protein